MSGRQLLLPSDVAGVVDEVEITRQLGEDMDQICSKKIYAQRCQMHSSLQVEHSFGSTILRDERVVGCGEVDEPVPVGAAVAGVAPEEGGGGVEGAGHHGRPAVGHQVRALDHAHVPRGGDDRVRGKPLGEAPAVGVRRLGIQVQDVEIPGVVQREEDAAERGGVPGGSGDEVGDAGEGAAGAGGRWGRGELVLDEEGRPGGRGGREGEGERDGGEEDEEEERERGARGEREQPPAVHGDGVQPPDGVHHGLHRRWVGELSSTGEKNTDFDRHYRLINAGFFLQKMYSSFHDQIWNNNLNFGSFFLD